MDRLDDWLYHWVDSNPPSSDRRFSIRRATKLFVAIMVGSIIGGLPLALYELILKSSQHREEERRQQEQLQKDWGRLEKSVHEGTAGEATMRLFGFTRPAAGQSFEWQVATPESQGMSKEKLDALKDELAKRKTHTFLIIRNDKTVYEWYAAGHGLKVKHGAASLSKATVAGLALALLLTDRKLQLDTPIAELVAAWKDDPGKRKITLRHLGSHTSGLADAEQDRLPHSKLTGWKGNFWKQLDPPNDPFTLARDKAPVLFEPGTKLQYSNPGIAMLGYAITAALKDTPHKDIRALLRERVMRPIGVVDSEWSIGYSRTNHSRSSDSALGE